MTETAILAVDGGGTRCRFALLAGGDRFEVERGPANVSTDFDGAMATLAEGFSAVIEAAGMEPRALAAMPTYLALAGVVDQTVAERVGAVLPMTSLRIADDRPATVRGALGDTDGFVAALGTGSFFARQQGGAIRLIGGWGARLGDEASGYWIGRSALSAVLDVFDGLDAETPLSAKLYADLGNTPSGVVDFAARATTTEIAALAPQVIAAAGQGDAIARHILGSGAMHITASLMALGWESGAPLCLTGGVAQTYRPYLADDLVAAMRDPSGSALDGALDLARAIGQGT